MEPETLNSTEAVPRSGERAEAVAPQEEQEQEPSRESADFELVDVGEDNGAGPAAGEKRARTREENAAIRAARLRARRDAEAAAVARADAGRGEDAARRAFLSGDVLDFMAKHPEMDGAGLAALESNPQFRRFCGSRFGREPLSGLYDDFRALMGDAGSAAVMRSDSRRARATGGGSGGNSVLSPSQKAALDAWNEAHPEMAMTAKEFLGR